MRITDYCYQCLENLVRKAVGSAQATADLKEKALREAQRYLTQNFLPDKIPAQLAGEMQRLIREITQDEDPFKTAKAEEMKAAAALFARVNPFWGNDLPALVSLAVLGNNVDFFLDLETVQKEMRAPVCFSRDDTPAFQETLTHFARACLPKRILYFADNAGEVYFDLPLLAKLEAFGEVTYVVKAKPVQNDLTEAELLQSGLREKIKRVINTGTDTPGLALSQASPSFKKELAQANLLVAKGMGYYETLPELSLSIPCFYLLKTKCPPVAAALGVPLNSYVAYFAS